MTRLLNTLRTGTGLVGSRVAGRVVLLPLVLLLALALVEGGAAPARVGAAEPVSTPPPPMRPVLHLPLVAHRFVAPAFVQSRFGVGVPLPYQVDSYDIGAVGARWYWDWAARSEAPTPGGVEYMPTVRLSQVGESGYAYSPNATAIAAAAAAHPGALWFVGNEPDCDRQDYLLPELYARAYHELYHLIRQHDPTARISAGHIVQPTALRLLYLDRVLSAYAQEYGKPLPVDVWVIHAYPLPEHRYDFGAGIPPGFDDVDTGLLIDIADTADPELFYGFVRTFRTWMADNGYRNKPLVISEFGVLMPEDFYGMDEASVIAYMDATIGFMLSETDPHTGYPADEDRLVQRWAWYKLVRQVDAEWMDQLAGDLYDGTTRARRAAGLHMAALAAAQPRTVNLRVSGLHATPVAGGVQLRAEVVNNGSIDRLGPVTVRFYREDPQAGGTLLGGAVLPNVRGGAIPQFASITWLSPPAGQHTVYAVVDPDGLVAETREDDNSLHIVVEVP